MKLSRYLRSADVADYTAGNIAKQMAAFALPHMLSSALQIMYSAVDLGIVGKYISGAALSAVSTSSHILTLFTMLGLGFATGGQIYMSQLLGMGERNRARSVTGTLFTAMLVMSLMLGMCTAIFHFDILKLMNTPAEAFEMAAQYLVPGSIGLLFTYIYNAMSAVMRATGDSRTPLYAIIASSLINLILDFLFVAVLRLGVSGAIAATVIGQAVSALVLIGEIIRRKDVYGFGLKIEKNTLDRKILLDLIRIGIPYALEMGIFNISMLFVSSMVNSVGLYASETFGIGLKVEEIGNKLCTGITCATSVMTGQAIASGKIPRVKKIVHTAWMYSGAMYVVFAILCFTCGKELFSVFVDDVEVMELAPVFISALSWGFPAMASMRGTNGLMQGVSNAKLSLFIGVIDGIVVRIPLSYMLGVMLGKGLYGFFLAYALAAYTNAGMGLVYYLNGRWKKQRLIAQKRP